MSQISASEAEREGLFFAPQPPRIVRWSRGLWHFTRTKRLGAFGAFLVITMALFALLADVIAPFAVDHQVLTERFQGPSAAHIMGTDNLGRDMFSLVDRALPSSGWRQDQDQQLLAQVA